MTARIAPLRLRQMLAPLRVLGMLSPAARLQALKRATGKIGDLRERIARRLLTGQFRAVQMLAGTRAASRFFWLSPTSSRIWFNVEARLYHLARQSPEDARDFAALAFARTGDPTVLIGLARNPLSRAVIAPLLAQADPETDAGLRARIERSGDYSAALAGIAALLLDPAAAEALAARITALQPALADRFFRVLDSLGTRPTVPPGDATLRALGLSGFRGPVRHRLIIAETLRDRRAIAQLFPGAGKVTVLGLNDTYGRASFEDYIESFGSADVVVEHVRSRITRFSQGYIRFHEVTRQAARDIVRELFGPGRPGAAFGLTDLPVLEVSLADQLFFQLLKTEAITQLLASGAFDHVVIACEGQPADSEFYRLLSGIGEIRRDPRIEILSVSRSMAARARFGEVLRTVLTDLPPKHLLPGWQPPIAGLAADLDRRTAVLAGRLPDCPAEGRPRVLIATAHNAAYDRSTADFARILAKDHAVTLAFAGSNMTGLVEALDAGGGAGSEVRLQPIQVAQAASFVALRGWIADRLAEILPRVADPALRHMLRVAGDRLAGGAFLNDIVFIKVIGAWFARLAAEGHAPDLVVLSPLRMPQVVAFAALARRHQIPSIGLEPHGLNANYCRYTKVMTDFYGVISDYFRQHAESGFAIPLERTQVIGSPRIIRPAGFDRAAARVAARARLSAEAGIAFDEGSTELSYFCQPSDWTHVARVWTAILKATEGRAIRVLIKTHPEETPSRRQAYLALADEFGAADRVAIVDGDPTTVIEASDLVLTGYSAAAIDAAVLGCPVFCVTEGPLDYPVDQHAIIGAPLLRSAAELAAAIDGFLADPGAYAARAEAFLEREPQFVEGPGKRLLALVDEVLSHPRSTTIRPAASLPDSIFLDGPHRVFAL